MSNAGLNVHKTVEVVPIAARMVSAVEIGMEILNRPLRMEIAHPMPFKLL